METIPAFVHLAREIKQVPHAHVNSCYSCIAFSTILLSSLCQLEVNGPLHHIFEEIPWETEEPWPEAKLTECMVYLSRRKLVQCPPEFMKLIPKGDYDVGLVRSGWMLPINS